MAPAASVRELNGLLIALREQGRPALAQVPNDQQLIARAKPDRLICICECGLAVAGERTTHAEIAAREYRIRIEVERATQPAPGFLMSAREQLVDRQRRMRVGVLVIDRDGAPRRLTAADK